MKHTQPVTSVSRSAADSRSVGLADILGPAVSRDEALAMIRDDPDSCRTFFCFPEKEQKRILGFIQGNHGLPILYDSFFKTVMNPDAYPERLERFLSALLQEPVRIRSVLPPEGTKIVDAGSLVIMDIVVELTDGTITDVEMQKIGYAFPGERSSCYIADFIMRQYNRVKSERKQAFSFTDLKPVWLIILMENSSPEFLAAAPHYLHRRMEYFDSGAKVHTLGKMLYISLDTFHKVVQNGAYQELHRRS